MDVREARDSGFSAGSRSSLLLIICSLTQEEPPSLCNFSIRAAVKTIVVTLEVPAYGPGFLPEPARLPAPTLFFCYCGRRFFHNVVSCFQTGNLHIRQLFEQMLIYFVKLASFGSVAY